MKRIRHTNEGRVELGSDLALTKEDVSILYVDTEGKKTFVTELNLDDDGSLFDPWPGGFFEEGFSERFL